MERKDFLLIANQIITDDESRKALPVALFNDIEDSFKKIQESNINSNDLQEVYAALCFLRNSCIKCKLSQDRICERDILSSFSDIMAVCLSPDFYTKCEEKDLLVKVKRVAVQFLGNLIVQNSFAKEKVWQLGFPSLFFNFFSNLNSKDKDIFCMIVYNCLKDRETLYSDDNEFWLLVSIIEHCNEYKEAEWGLFVMETIILSNDFGKFFKQLDYPNLKGCLLDVIHSHLVEPSGVYIPEKTIIYLCEHFIAKAMTILKLAVTVTEELIEASNLLLKNLEILSEATLYPQKYPRLRTDRSLFDAVLKLLEGVSSVENASFFSHPSDPTIKDSETHPAFGFKRDLIQIIANLLYDNVPFQNIMRESDGIKHLLNACNVDNKNPFMMQYAIFAIRNLCYGNLENQNYIKSLEKQGVVTNDFLTKSNVTATMRDGKIVVSDNGVK